MFLGDLYALTIFIYIFPSSFFHLSFLYFFLLVSFSFFLTIFSSVIIQGSVYKKFLLGAYFSFSILKHLLFHIGNG